MKKTIAFLKRFKAFIRNDQDIIKRRRKFEKQLDIFKENFHEQVEITEYACLYDDTQITKIEPHYTYHPAWAARVLAHTNPVKHIDISSTTHFSTIVSAFIPVEFYDYRPANIILSNYSSGKTDLINLQFESNSIKSLSCMHTVEHIGLGRYGDPIDVNGDKKAMKELARVLAKKGNLLFVVPVGRPQIAFNAHRIYDYNTIINNFGDLTLKEFCLIPDDFAKTGYLINPPKDLVNEQKWGCGCFWFTKL